MGECGVLVAEPMNLCPDMYGQQTLASARRPDTIAVRRLAGHGAADREQAARFITDIFAHSYGARVPAVAPDLLTLARQERLLAAAGWRGAAEAPLYLERYLDEPIELAVARVAGRPIARARIAEACNLAARPGYGVRMVHAMARQLDHEGYEWVAFTATRELVAIFSRMGLPLLALAPAVAHRAGPDTAAWGRYYDTAPVVVAGRIRVALNRRRHD